MGRRRKNHSPQDQCPGGVIIAVASIVTSGITTAFGTMAPALGEGKAVATALTALAQQPDASATITRTLFVGLAMIESTAIREGLKTYSIMIAPPST
jgi:F-type H+-transporting ATPase subunit c